MSALIPLFVSVAASVWAFWPRAGDGNTGPDGAALAMARVALYLVAVAVIWFAYWLWLVVA